MKVKLEFELVAFVPPAVRGKRPVKDLELRPETPQACLEVPVAGALGRGD